MPQETAVTAVAHTIQLSVAPVFLLSGVGAMLAVLTSRVARVVDRARVLEGHLGGSTPADAARMHVELNTLSRRAKLISHAIAFCTVAALLVCAVIAALFISAFARFNAAAVVALLFIAAMIVLFIGLVQFLREIFIATANIRIGPH